MGSDGTHRHLKIILGVVLIAEVVISLSLANEGLSWKEEDEWDALAASFKNGIRTFAAIDWQCVALQHMPPTTLHSWHVKLLPLCAEFAIACRGRQDFDKSQP